MEIIRYIFGEFSEQLNRQLKKYNIVTEIGWNTFEIKNEELFVKIRDLLKREGIHISTNATFTKEECKKAAYGVITAMHTCGYPQPDHNFGYLNLTYDLTNYCEECGAGKVQKDAFRISKIAKHKMFELGWIDDELFVHTDIYNHFFKPMGIGCRIVRKYHSEDILESVVQLLIPETSEKLFLPDEYNPIKCIKCGTIKYTPHVIDYFPLQKVPIGPIYKGAEYYGSGHVAKKNIYVSAELRDMLVKHKIAHLQFFSPCKNS